VRPGTLFDAFRYAGEGLATAFVNERNFRIHVALGTLAVELAVLLGLPRWQWAILILAVGEVLTLELINTAVEAVVDLASPGRHRLAKLAKDEVAAAVLVEALTAVFVGVLIFGPHLLSLPRVLLVDARTRPASLAAMVVVWLGVVAAGLAVGRRRSAGPGDGGRNGRDVRHWQP
jgi:diacylglycerol kinase